MPLCGCWTSLSLPGSRGLQSPSHEQTHTTASSGGDGEAAGAFPTKCPWGMAEVQESHCLNAIAEDGAQNSGMTVAGSTAQTAGEADNGENKGTELAFTLCLSFTWK